MNKNSSSKQESQQVKITVHNQVQHSQGPSKIEVTLPSNTAIASLLD